MTRVQPTARGSRAWRLALACLLGAALPCTPGWVGLGHAAPDDVGVHVSPKVVVLGGYPSLDRAVRTSLAPWHMRIEVVAARSPGSTMPLTALRARALAEELDADAIVWVSDSPDGAALWVHDARTGNVTARATPNPPFDVPTAAALALSVKTILRASGLSPEPRGAATEAPDSAATVLPAATPRAQPASEPREPPPPEPAPEAEPPPHDIDWISLPDPSWQLLIHGAVRFGAFQPAENGARYGLQLRWSPWAETPSEWRGLWFGLDAETSTPWVVSEPEFEGEYWELAPGLCAGMTRSLSRIIQVGLQVRSSLHLVYLSGTLTESSTHASISTQSPSVLVRPELGFRVGNVVFLLQPGAGVFLKRQAYRQEGVDFLETQTVWWMLGGAIAVRAE
ncbi:MAG TPA: hypothetical protein VNN80_00035 [Polyangiaceae bacterium]|jgi:hypothetical protein|nr:hypothetical protein [Polyangiaceae bacterium]